MIFQSIIDNKRVLTWVNINQILPKLESKNPYHQDWINTTNTFGGSARKKEYLAIRLLLQQVLETDKFNIIYDNYGKPHLQNPPYYLSIAHSKTIAAALLHPTQNNGLDIEQIHPRILKIQQKFLSTTELTHFQEDVLKLTAAWSIKEAVYKWYGKKGLDFKKHMQIQTALQDINPSNTSPVNIPVAFTNPQNEHQLDLSVSLIVIKDHVFAYVFGD